MVHDAVSTVAICVHLKMVKTPDCSADFTDLGKIVLLCSDELKFV